MIPVESGDAVHEKIGAVMVVGGGIGGIQATLDLADAGFKVYLVEDASAIGGEMAQLDKTFPTNDCSMCTISPKLIEVGKHRNVEIITNAQVEAVSGEPGNFRVRVRQRPRYIDPEKCNSCGDCVAQCPVELPNEFDEQLAFRKAIYKRYPQAIPNAMAISKNNRAPCTLTCPAGVNVQGYVALISQEKFQEAYRLIRDRNPLPGSLGRICHHPCEGQCHRGEWDEPIAINPLKRFLADWVRASAGDQAEGLAVEKYPIDLDKPKVAVVGSGPSGLACAQDLARKGYPVTIFEAEAFPGGFLRNGIPGYRLPKEVVEQEIQALIHGGIELQVKTPIGPGRTLDDLREKGYQAIYLGIGAGRSRRLDVPGKDLTGVYWGVDFLRLLAQGRMVAVGPKVVVIGGGNVAIDAARSSLRLGARSVQLVCLEGEGELPAYPEEIQEAVEEGVTILPAWGPEALQGAGERLERITLVRCTRVLDEAGRFNPVFDPQDHLELEADTVIIAIGQVTDSRFFGSDTGIEITPAGTIEVDPLTFGTGREGVFAGGDGVTGPKSAIEAIQQGHEAAVSIDRYLRGEDLQAGRAGSQSEPAPFPGQPLAKAARQKPGRRALEARQSDFLEPALTLTREQAVIEAKRCLNCGLCSECLQCVSACEAGAVGHDFTEQVLELQVGSLVFTPGFEKFQARLKGEYGHGRMKNVVTSLEFERILSASGPYQGRVVRPSDRKAPRKVAWIQCVGSRDGRCGNEYCSSVCCMAAAKEAIMAIDHVPGLEATVFYNDIRAFGKGFEFYYQSTRKHYGVRYVKGIISAIKELQQTRNLLLHYTLDQGGIWEEEFDLVVLSVGLVPHPEMVELAGRIGLDLNRFGFCQTSPFTPNRTSRPGVFVAGAFGAPMDIAETVMNSSSAAALSAELLSEVRGTQVREKSYPPEQDLTGEAPRVGVFVCHCGTNIARVVDVPETVAYAQTLPGVVYAVGNLYTCSADAQKRIVQTIREQRLNRVVVASCSPRTHEPLFQDSLREAGLNPYLFEMANIRDQCSWVHPSHPDLATEKAKDLIRMAVARAGLLEPLQEILMPVVQSALVIGGGVTGMTAALSLAEQGFKTFLVEREKQLGGNAHNLHYTLDGRELGPFFEDLLQRIRGQARIQVFTETEVETFGGHVGNFKTTIRTRGKRRELFHGVVIITTGAREYQPQEYGFGSSARILTQVGLERRLAQLDQSLRSARNVVMIQCVGSRDDQHPFCSRVCCSQAIKNALKLKELNPTLNIFVLYRDIRAYGFQELYYQRARELGVLFLRFREDRLPEVTVEAQTIELRVWHETLQREIALEPDYLILSAGIHPHLDCEDVAHQFKLPLNGDRFFLEAHIKLRPLEFAKEGMFLAGLAHSPGLISECLAQARGAAARAATILSRDQRPVGGVVSVVDQDRCAACLTCVRECPFQVPALTEAGKAAIEPAACQGCGICASACPRKAIELQHYKDRQLLAKCEAILDPREAWN